MPHAAEPVTDDEARLLAVADTLAPRLSAASDEIERSRHLPPPIADALADAGLYAMLIPRDLGGRETAVPTYVQVIESLARADASAAWCTFISNTSALIAGYLPADEAGRIFARRPLKMAGVFAPRGRAQRVEREGVPGFLVSGTWPWGSGSMNAHVITGGCLVVGADGKPETLPDGRPDVRSILFDASQVTIADTWHTLGLAGTGSHEFRVHEAFVPAARSASLLADTPRPGALYAFPLFCLLGLGIAAVALGVARRAIDELVALSHDKIPQGSRRVLAERAATQQHVARSEARWRSARAFLLEASQAAWAAAQAGAAIPVDLRRDLRLATTHATDEAAQVVNTMYSAGGGSTVFASSPLQRCLRDVHVATQHMMVGESTYELTGRLFLGLPTDAGLL